MKKAIKTFLLACVGLVMLLPPVNVQAGDINDLSDTNNELREMLNEALEANESLREQLENASTPNVPPAITVVERKPIVYAPMVHVLSPLTVNVEPDETKEIELVVRNIGSTTAENVLTQAVPGEGAPFTLEFVRNTNSVNALGEGRNHTMTLLIHVKKDAKPGAYTIDLTHYFKSKDSENSNVTDKINVQVGGDPQSPNVILREFKVDRAELRTEDTFTLTALIENAGEGEAQEVQASLNELDTANIYPVGDPASTYFTKMAGRQSETMSFSFKVADKAKTGAYLIPFKLTYRDEEAEEPIEKTYTYFVNVTASDEDTLRPSLEIQDLTGPDSRIGVGETAQFSMRLVNTGYADAKNIKITAASATADMLVPRASNIQTLQSLPVNGSHELTFAFSPTAEAKTQSYMIGFKVEYENSEENETSAAETENAAAEMLTFEQYAAVNVYNPEADEKDDEEEKTPKPKMIISEYRTEPQIAQAGKEFDLFLTFQNANATKAVNNIKITLTALEATEDKGAVFTPVSGSNTFYVDELAPKGEVSRTFRMYTVPDADPRSYNIQIDFSYQDQDYNEYTEKETISINVKQTTRLEISDPVIPETVTLGQPIYLNFNIINSGKVSLSNLRVRVDGDFDTTNANMYIGNLAKGNPAYYEGSITPLTPGKQSGTIVAHGEDDTGELVEITFPFSVEVVEMVFDESQMPEGMGNAGRMGMDGEMLSPDAEQSFFGKVWDIVKRPYVWGTAAAVIIVLVIVIVRVLKRKNKRIDFDE